jgi:hypothetical protein
MTIKRRWADEEKGMLGNMNKGASKGDLEYSGVIALLARSLPPAQLCNKPITSWLLIGLGIQLFMTVALKVRQNYPHLAPGMISKKGHRHLQCLSLLKEIILHNTSVLYSAFSAHASHLAAEA